MPQFGRNLRAWMDSTTRTRVTAFAAALDDAPDFVAACRYFWSVFIRGYLADPLDDATQAKLRGDVCNAPPDAIRNNNLVSASVPGPMGAWDWREEFKELPMPVLILHGENDPMPPESATEWQAAFPNSTIHFVERSGHFPQAEQPEEFLRLVNVPAVT